jgi:putative ABC transport system permease protein
MNGWSLSVGRLGGDLRHALRGFRRRPAVPALVVAILALGLGGFLALWSAADAVLWRPLPYEEPERLVRVWGSGNGERRNNANPLDAADWKAQVRSFESLGVLNASSATVSDWGAPEYVPVARVTSELFRVLRVEPALGRFFTQREHIVGEHRVAVLSWESWQSHFAGSPDVLGRRIRLDGFPYVIVGVAPRGLANPAPDLMRPAALYRPFAVDPATAGRGGHWVQVFGRLKPDATVAAAQAELDAITRQTYAEHPEAGAEEWKAFVEPLHQAIAGPSRQALVLLVAATGLLLLLACGNVAALLLARSTSRGAELAVRGALGASRGGLVRQLLLEVLVLGLVAGVGGVLLGRALLRGLALLAAGQVPLLERAAIDGRALLVGLAATLLTVLIAGAAPSLHGVRAALVPSDGRRTTASRERRRLERVLVAAQLALCLTLLVGAALLARSLERLYRVDPGFRTAHALTFGLYLPGDRYPDEAAQRAFFGRLEERLGRLPEVEAVGGVSNLPLGGGYSCSAAVAEGSVVVDAALRPCAEERIATPGYFDAIGLRRIAGRTFTAADDENAAPVVVVSESFARHHWPGRSPLGRRMKWGLDASSSDPWRTVVGVVRDVRHFGYDAPVRPEIYMPEAQKTYDGLDVVVRSSTPAVDLLPTLRRVVAEVDPQLPLARPRALDELLADSTATRRLRAWMVGGFAALALLLATAGLYGSLAHAVGVRRRELSVRMAVGAGKRQIVGLVMGEGAALTAVGLLAGGAGALAASRALRQLLFGVEPLDPTSFAAAAALLAAVAMLASWLPARRAAAVDPVRALRED